MHTEKITKITYIGKKRCLDIEVANKDHLFVANGLICQNSHSVGYAVNSYLYSIYPKVHFPKAFFTSQLEFVKEMDEIEGFVEDAKSFNVVVKKPDLRNKNPEFNIKGEDIVFGLASIKGVGKSVVESLVRLLDDFELSGASWISFLLKVASETNSGALKAIIKSGAVDFLMQSRAKMLFELDIFHELNVKQQTFLKETQPESLISGLQSMINLGTGKFSMCANKKSLEKLNNLLKTMKNPPYSMQDSYRSIAQMEREMLGYEFTCTELDNSDMLSYASHSCEDLIKVKPSNKTLKVPALIKRVATHKSAGGLMGFVEFRDSTASINFGVCFADSWEKFKGILYENNKVILAGIKTQNPGRSASFMIQGVHQI